MTSPTPTEARNAAARTWDEFCARIYIARRAAEREAARNPAQPERMAA